MNIRNKLTDYHIIGLPLPFFISLLILLLIATYTNALPNGMIGAFMFTMIIGAFLNEIGNKPPFIKDYIGGGSIIAIFGSSLLFTYHVLPQNTYENVCTFMNSGGFLYFCSNNRKYFGD